MAISHRVPTHVRDSRITAHSDLCRRRTPGAATLTAVAECMDADRCLRCRYLRHLLDTMPARPKDFRAV
jgi:hypothetical protein